MALEVLPEEAKPLELNLLDHVRSFRGSLNGTVQSAHACGDCIEVTDNLTSFGSLVFTRVDLHRKSFDGLACPMAL